MNKNVHLCKSYLCSMKRMLMAYKITNTGYAIKKGTYSRKIGGIIMSGTNNSYEQNKTNNNYQNSQNSQNSQGSNSTNNSNSDNNQKNCKNSTNNNNNK